MRSPEPGSTGKAGLLAAPTPLEGAWLGLALALLTCLPFLVAAQPQMADYPSHLARYAIMLDGGRSEWLARYYRFDWRWSGNLGADLLIWPMAKLFGLELGGKLLAMAIPPLTALAMMTVEWTLRRRIGVGSMLALATVWSPVLLLGMLNFSLALALALFAFAGWVRLEGWRWRWLVFLPAGLLVWLCHLAGWGVLGVLVLGYQWQRRRSLTGLLALWPLALPLIPQLLSGGGGHLTNYGPNVWLYKRTIATMALRDQSWWVDIATPLLLLAAFVAAAWFKRLDWRLGWAAVIFALLALVLPRHLGGGDYTDYRLLAVALTAGSLAIDWPAPRLALWLAPALFLLRLSLTTAAWQQSSRDVEAMLGALDHVPQGARIAAAVVQDTSDWRHDLLQHAPSYATIRRDALVNTHFAQPGVHMLTLRQGPPDFTDLSQRILHPKGAPIDLAGFAPARHADYLWYIGRQQPTTMPEGATILYYTPHSFLARLAKAAPAR